MLNFSGKGIPGWQPEMAMTATSLLNNTQCCSSYMVPTCTLRPWPSAIVVITPSLRLFISAKGIINVHCYLLVAIMFVWTMRYVMGILTVALQAHGDTIDISSMISALVHIKPIICHQTSFTCWVLLVMHTLASLDQLICITSHADCKIDLTDRWISIAL